MGTAKHSLILTALKSDFEKVSKSTYSSNRGSISTLERSSFLTGFGSAALAGLSSIGFIVGNQIRALYSVARISISLHCHGFSYQGFPYFIMIFHIICSICIGFYIGVPGPYTNTLILSLIFFDTILLFST